jgi:hypothetical protein
VKVIRKAWRPACRRPLPKGTDLAPAAYDCIDMMQSSSKTQDATASECGWQQRLILDLLKRNNKNLCCTEQNRSCQYCYGMLCVAAPRVISLPKFGFEVGHRFLTVPPMHFSPPPGLSAPTITEIPIGLRLSCLRACIFARSLLTRASRIPS